MVHNYKGVPLYNPPEKTDSLRRKIKRLKEKQKMQKTIEGEKTEL